MDTRYDTVNNVKYKASNDLDEKLADKQSPDKNSEDSKEEIPSVSFFTLFRFATRTEKFQTFVALLFSVIAGAMSPFFSLLFARLLQSMVDYGMSIAAGSPNNAAFTGAIRHFAIYNCIVGAVVIILSYGATTLANISAYQQIFKIRKEYLKSAMNQEFEYFDSHQTGDFASKMSEDVIKLENGIGENLATFLFYQATFLSSVIMALVKGWKLALLCLITFPITMLLVGAAGLIAARTSKKELKAMGRAGNVAEEVLSAVRTVYAFNGQQKEIDRYTVHLKKARGYNIKKGLYNGIAMGILFFCIYCAYALSFWFGYQFIIHEPQNYNVETMIAVFFGVMMGSVNFGISATLMEMFGIARGAGAQIFYLIDRVPKINTLLNQGVTPDTVDGNIELKNVVFHYPTRPDVKVLNNVSLSIKRGQSVALVGHSGCGKSTIIQLICRYYDVVDGSVTLDNNDVRKLAVQWLRSKIGTVGQEPVLFNATVRENIRYGRQDATDIEIESVTKQANAHQFIMKLPKGYDTLVGERGASLSGGQKQRIAIARALVRDPRILLLDEATSALDTASEAKVQEALNKVQKGRTTIIVAHRLSTIRDVDVIYVFKKGEIVEFGNHEELIKKKGHYFDLVSLQLSPDEMNASKDNSIPRPSLTNEDVDEIPAAKNLIPEEEEKVQDASFLRVIKLNAPEWKSITIASICSLVNGFGTPTLAIVLGDFVAVLVNPNSEEAKAEVKKFIYVFIGVGIISGLINFTQVYFYGIAGEYLTERLRRTLFKILLQQDGGFFDEKNNSTGALCARLSGEAAAVQGATGQRIGTILQAIGTFFFALILALIYEWRVGLVALTFVPIMGAIVYKQDKMILEESSSSASTMEKSSKIAVEAVANIRTVASLGREKRVLQEYAAQLTPALRVAKRSAHWRGLVFGLSRGVFNFVYAAALYYGGTLIVNRGASYENVLKSAQALLMGASSAAQAFAFAPSFQKGLKAAGRVLALLNRKSKITDPDVPAVENFVGSGQASLENVQFRFPTRPMIQVLKGLNLEIEKGKTIALVGASGCGKSTVIVLLERFYDPESGIVAQDGIPLPKLRLPNVRQTIGLVQQEPILFDRTIAENIAYGDNSRKPDMDEIQEAAKQANIHNFVTSLPLGYDTNIGNKGTLLSGGQKQRIAIARALIRRPKLLLLDEATSALDTESEKVVQETLDKAKQGRTCVTIAHRMSTIRDADVITVVHEGQIAEAGTHSELMNAKGRYYALNQRGYS